MLFQILPFGTYGLNIAIAIITIMLIISGIILGLGYSFDDRRLKEIGKNEIYQAIINSILVGSFLILFVSQGLITQLVNSLTLGSVSNSSNFSCPAYMTSNLALCFAYNYLVGPQSYTYQGNTYNSLLITITGLLVALAGLNVILGIIGSISVNLVVVSFSFSSAISPFLNQIQYIIGILTALSIGVVVQSAIITFIALTATTIILPLGLILRTFSPTRKLGGFFIAVSVGTYIVLPLSYLLNVSLINAYTTNFDTRSINQLTVNASSVEWQITSANLHSVQALSLFSSVSNALSDLLNQLNTLFNSLIYFLSALIVQVFILPAFSLIITAVSIKELAQLLGSDAFFGKFRIL